MNAKDNKAFIIIIIVVVVVVIAEQKGCVLTWIVIQHTTTYHNENLQSRTSFISPQL